MEFIYLPLVSYQNGKHVPKKSGLNQFNAGGRPRKVYEVYIPVFKEIHRNYPDFFPGRDYFSLYLPNGEKICASLCQDGKKALMSNPNSDLGEWLLRDVLNQPLGQIVVDQDLINKRIDSVIIYKKNNQEYTMAIAPFGAYDSFRRNLR